MKHLLFFYQSKTHSLAVCAIKSVSRSYGITPVRKLQENKKSRPLNEVRTFGAAGRIRTADLILTKAIQSRKSLLSKAFRCFTVRFSATGRGRSYCFIHILHPLIFCSGSASGSKQNHSFFSSSKKPGNTSKIMAQITVHFVSS